MTERFPPDCSSVSGRFRNTTFICFGPSAASLALRAHSRGLRPPVLVLRLLRFATRLVSPRSTAPLSCALAAGLSPCLAPSAASLSLRASGHLARLLRCAALRARRRAVAPSGSFGCSPSLRASGHLARLLRYAARLGSPRSTAPLRSAPRVTSLDCSATLRASGHLARLLRYAARSRSGWRPVWLLRLPAPLRASGHLARLLRCAARSRPVWLLRLLRCRSASTCVRDFTSDGPVLRWRAQRRTVFPARSIHF